MIWREARSESMFFRRDASLETQSRRRFRLFHGLLPDRAAALHFQWSGEGSGTLLALPGRYGNKFVGLPSLQMRGRPVRFL